MAKGSVTLLDITSHYRKSHENHNEIPLYAHQDSCNNFLIEYDKCRRGCEEIVGTAVVENSLVVLQKVKHIKLLYDLLLDIYPKELNVHVK